MRHENFGAARGGPPPRGRYAASRLEVRGPLRRIDRGYIACPGGTETFGPGLEQPFPALLERSTGRACVNLGTLNAGIGALLGDAALLAMCQGAERVVLQVTGAQGLANRFYSVHPRRNDRFLRASAKLRALYPEIDFTDFCFVRHMLESLHSHEEARFALVRDELRVAWSMRMRSLIAQLGVPVTLVVLPVRLGHGRLGDDPLFVTTDMIEALRPVVRHIVMAPRDGRPEAARHRAVARDLARLFLGEDD
ncbi:DUF6473 family protein [Limimaricola hongkongensis]|uniref:DUF6473 domain-containing protein n=1 Tax=Limimaricola hongkongensis DSM 17492 TaxID=1122180 RepID=A0A017HE06_9RHOB|nr:DUF6473 family protein [Limimaricola hongkongensis]EYD72571.1 hypothetical protein Lokhon_01372 [Limimaricola hongkongensis DSM 17492]